MAFMKFFLLEPERGIVSVVYRLLHLCSAALLRLVITFTTISSDIFVSKTSLVTVPVLRWRIGVWVLILESL